MVYPERIHTCPKARPEKESCQARETCMQVRACSGSRCSATKSCNSGRSSMSSLFIGRGLVQTFFSSIPECEGACRNVDVKAMMDKVRKECRGSASCRTLIFCVQPRRAFPIRAPKLCRRNSRQANKRLDRVSSPSVSVFFPS